MSDPEDNTIIDSAEYLIDVDIYDDDDDDDEQTIRIYNDIHLYANNITGSDFHGNLILYDYLVIFRVAAEIANDIKQTLLNNKEETFYALGQFADDLGKLFASFIIKLENANIINNIHFLTTVSFALKNIWMLSEAFGRLKHIIGSNTEHDLGRILIDCENCFIYDVNDDIDTTPSPIAYRFPSYAFSFE